MNKATMETRIRDIPKEVWDLMKERAKRNYRSLNSQVLADLEDISNAEKALKEAASQEYEKQASEDAGE